MEWDVSPSVGAGAGVVWGDLRGCLMAVSLAPDEFSVKLGNGTGSRGLRSRGRNRSCTPPARDKQNSGLSVSCCPSSGDVRNEHHWFMGDGEEKKRGYTRDFCGAQGHKSCMYLDAPKKRVNDGLKGCPGPGIFRSVTFDSGQKKKQIETPNLVGHGPKLPR